MGDTIEQRKKQLIESCDKYHEIVPLDDGFQYFWIANRGALSALDLRTIADELDRRNEEWSKEIEAYFASSERQICTQ